MRQRLGRQGTTSRPLPCPDYACFRPGADAADSPSRANPRVRRLEVMVTVFITSMRLGMDHAISPMSRFPLNWSSARSE